MYTGQTQGSAYLTKMAETLTFKYYLQLKTKENVGHSNIWGL